MMEQETRKTVTEEEVKKIIKEHAYQLWLNTVNKADEFIQEGYDYAYSHFEWDGDDVGFTLTEIKEWTKELENKMKTDNDKKPTLEELLEKCTPENRHEEIDFGEPVGKEIGNMENYYLIDLERTIGSGRTHYWKANRHGYTMDLNEAGLFDEPVAKRICDEDFDKRTIMVSEKVVDRIVPNMVHPLKFILTLILIWIFT
jgi:hypothetical protein